MNEDARALMDIWYADFCETLPPRLREVTIASYALTNADGTPRGDVNARDRIAMWTEAFPDVKRGLFLTGPTGAGKTHLAVGALKAVLHRLPAKVRYIHLPEYLDRRRRMGIDDRREFGQIFRRDALVCLDEIGALKSTDWLAEQVYLLCDALWQADKRIIVTSNQSYAELAGLYGERTVSRLVDLTERVAVDAADDRVARARREGAR